MLKRNIDDACVDLWRVDQDTRVLCLGPAATTAQVNVIIITGCITL